MGEEQLIDDICDQIGFKAHVVGDEDSSEGSNSHEGHLPELNPFHDFCVFVEDFSLFEIQGFMRLRTWGFNERLINVGWVENIVFEPEKPFKWGSNELWVTKSVSYVFELFFRFHLNVVLVTL